MSDFLIDFRKNRDRRMSKAVELMRYFNDIKVSVYDYEKFTLVLSRCDDWYIWSPYESIDNNTFIALSGRIALESKEWEEAKEEKGEGGLACKAIYKMYKSGGIDNLRNLNGNCVVIVYDSVIQKVYIIIDRCGMFPCFKASVRNGELVLSSHQDILAAILDTSQDWDFVSFGEFLMTGKVTFPHSYYKRIKALDYGCIHTIDLASLGVVYESKKKYFDFNFQIDYRLREDELAEELAQAFRKAVNKRVMPIFGQAAISLSGGLDSRIILCSVDNKESLCAFCFYDENNLEYKTAKDITKAAGVKFIPLKRNFDYYGDSAEMGVRISGGTGNIFNNHYLGFRKSLIDLGLTNLLAGFYLDRLFKGYVIGKKVNKFLRTESLGKFKYESNQPISWFNTMYANDVRERLSKIFSKEIREDESDRGKLVIEQKRIFPLFTESENPATIIPQRVMGWYLPAIDNDIIDLYLRIQPKFKLNPSKMYSAVVLNQCGQTIGKIIYANTGARVDVSRVSYILNRHKRTLIRYLRGIKKGLVTDESWPNWGYYIRNSKKIGRLWMENNKMQTDIFRELLGVDPYKIAIQDYTKSDRKLTLFFRLITLKLWLNQRI